MISFRHILLCVATISAISCKKYCADEKAVNYQLEQSANNGCIYPETVNINAIGVNSFPLQDMYGEEWDTNGNPNKFIKIFNNETDKLLFESETESYSPVKWIIDPLISLNSEKVLLRIELYDLDLEEEIIMDKAIIDFATYTIFADQIRDYTYPNEFEVIGENSTIFSLAVNWTE